MFNFRFSLTNPWWIRFENIYSAHGKTPLKHKCWEVQLMKSDDLVAFDLRITTRSDHAGVDLWIGLLGFAVNMLLYDDRHWNIEEKDWEKYE